MKIKFLLTTFLLALAIVGFGQDRFFTRNGKVSFFSETPVENIKAVNNQVSCVLDMATGNIAFSAQMKGFEFEKALMQEHFNENYVESDKFPAATFKGQIVEFDKAKLQSGDPYEVTIKGELALHGVSKPLETTATLKWSENKISGNSVFKVKVADYDIRIPKTVINNIAESVEVTVEIELEPYQK